MNEQIVNYLATNRDKYPRAVLTNMLVKSGYNPKEIEDAAAMVFGGQANSDGSGPSAPLNFWDFSTKIVYDSPAQRRKDFWFGFWAPLLSTVAFSWVPALLLYASGMAADLSFIKDIFNIINSVAKLAIFVGIFYLWNRRRSISYGIIGGYLFNFFVSIIIVGVIISMIGLAFIR